jgi:peptide-methionine (S)-S-oxide reductase|tara:strand:- start:785 stop:1312 length:528 start_codon:yes stop_codon:yes gene_type:complete
MNSVIYLGGGCFWCTESVYKNINGVISITPGYMGGNNPNPTYEEVCEGYTNHVEVIKVNYDHSLSLDQVLSIFFSTHDPTSINRQGADVGTQYRSAVFCNQDERKAVIDFIKNLEVKNIFEDKIVTEVNDIVPFYEAENYHHDFFTKNPQNPYCQAVINPKLKKLRSNFSDLISK